MRRRLAERDDLEADEADEAASEPAGRRVEGDGPGAQANGGKPDADALGAKPEGHPYRVPGTRFEEVLPEAPKSRAGIMLALAALGGLVLLGIVRAVAVVPMQRPQEPIAAAVIPFHPAEPKSPLENIVVSSPAPSSLILARKEELELSTAIEQNDYPAMRAKLLPKLAILECREVHLLVMACWRMNDYRCASATYPRQKALSCAQPPLRRDAKR